MPSITSGGDEKYRGSGGSGGSGGKVRKITRNENRLRQVTKKGTVTISVTIGVT